MEILENQLKDNINNLNTNITESNDITLRRRFGLTPKSIGSMLVGNAVGSQIQQKQTSEFISGAVTSALTSGNILKGGISTLGSAELGSAVSSLIEDKATANIVDNAVTMGAAPIVESVGEFALGRIASSVGLAAASPFIAPELAVIAGLTAVGAGIGSVVNMINK